ncbi:MAG: hypothetical protein JRD68_15010 [Deltaproteobacteria bacterium]|nr:hypothetical protein [Deltaproteobacteria bacterium]
MIRLILAVGICITLILIPQVLPAEIAPSARVMEKLFDFGRLQAKDSPQVHDFIIMNTGEMDLRILSVSPG